MRQGQFLHLHCLGRMSYKLVQQLNSRFFKLVSQNTRLKFCDKHSTLNIRGMVEINLDSMETNCSVWLC